MRTLNEIEADITDVFNKQRKLHADYKRKMKRLDNKLDKLEEELNEAMKKAGG